jgi:hypothetical protein
MTLLDKSGTIYTNLQPCPIFHIGLPENFSSLVHEQINIHKQTTASFRFLGWRKKLVFTFLKYFSEINSGE